MNKAWTKHACWLQAHGLERLSQGQDDLALLPRVSDKIQDKVARAED